MNTRTSRGRVLFAALGLAGALLTTSGVTVHAEPNASASAGLVGVWGVQVTLRDCASGAPLGAPLNSLVSAHRGGTMSESAASLAFAPGQRTPGHGTWARKGSHSYRQKRHRVDPVRHGAQSPRHADFSTRACPCLPGSSRGG